jgi:hypothetical protein
LERIASGKRHPIEQIKFTPWSEQAIEEIRGQFCTRYNWSNDRNQKEKEFL